MISFLFLTSCQEALQTEIPSFAKLTCAMSTTICPTIEKVVPNLATPGSTITVHGKNLTEGLKISIDGSAVATECLDETNCSFVMPEGADGWISFDVSVRATNSLLDSPLNKIYRQKETGYPLMAVAASEVCSGTTFTNVEGDVESGSRVCTDAPVCSKEGQSNCLTNKTYTSALITGLKNKVIAGQSVAGVSGAIQLPLTCAADGQTGCVALGPMYAAATVAGAADKLLIGQTLGGVTGAVTLPPANKVLTGDTYGSATSPLAGSLTLPLASDVRLSSADYGDPTAQLVPTYNGGGPLNCSVDGQSSCVADGALFKAMDISGAASKIVSGQTLAGVAGNFAIPAVSRVVTGTSFGVAGTSLNGTLTLPAAANVKSGTVAYGIAAALLTPSYTPDFPSLTNVRATDTVDGQSGSLIDCSAANQSGCVATPNYKTMNLTVSGIDAGLTSTNFNATIKASGNFEFWDVSGARHSVAGDTDLSAANVKSSTDIFGVVGSSVSETHSSCTASNQSGCLATATYKTMDLSSPSLAATTDITATNFNTTLAAAGNFEFWDSTGTRHQVAGDPSLTDANIVTGATIFGVAGTVSGVPPACSSSGTQGCVATGSYFAATACSANSSNCYLPNYVLTTQPLKAISYDAIETGKTAIRSSLTLSGITGTLNDCSTDGDAGCVVIGPTYAALLKTGTQDKILFGNTIGSVAGNVTLPAVNKVLTGINYGVSGTGLSGTLTLPLASTVKTGSGTFGDPSSALTPSFSPDFPSVTNVLSTDTVDGVTGTLTLPAASKVISPTAFGVGGNGSTGTLTLPLAINVKSGTASYGEAGSLLVPNFSPDFPSIDHVLSSDTVDGAAGTLTLPAATKVITGTSFGVAGNGSSGSLSLPLAANVKTGTSSYGEPGSLQVPAYSPDFPSVGNVLSSDTVDGIAGTLSLPSASKVLSATNYGVAGNGSTGSLTLPTAATVLIGSPAYGETGSLLSPSYTPDFPSVANVHSSDTVNGLTGTLLNCTAANQSGCVATTSYKTMNLSASGTDTGLTSSNFNTSVKTAANFEFWDAAGARHSVAGDADLVATNIANAVNIFGTVGSANLESHSACSAANQSGCVATSIYKTMDLSSASIATTTDLTSTNFNATLATSANFEFWDSAGARYQVAGNASLIGSNILSGVTLFGAVGSATASPAACATNGAQSCVATGSYRAATSCTADGSNCFLPAYTVTTQPLKAISYDIINTNKGLIRSSLTLSGIGGTLNDCSTDGSAGCVVVGPTYSALLKTDAQDKILSGNTIGGVTGNVILPAVAKVLTGTSYGVSGTGLSGTLTLPLAADVKSGTAAYGEVGTLRTPSYSPDFPAVGNVLTSDTVDGVTGTLILPLAAKVLTGTTYGAAGNGSNGTLTLPLAANVLTGSGTYGETGSLRTPSYSPDFPSVANVRSSDTVNNVTGTLGDCTAANQSGCVSTTTYKTMDLTSVGTQTGLSSTNFNTTVKTAANFEFWDASGARHSVAGDADLAAANIANGIVIFGNTGTSTVESHSNCTAANQSGCVSTSTYKTMDFSSASIPTTTDLTSSNFNTTIATNANFEFWDSAGARYQVAGDNDLVASNVKSGTNIFGVAGSVTAESHSNCAVDNSTGCVAIATFKAVETAKLTAGVIKNGYSVGGVSGLYPSSGFPLAGNTATQDLTNATFNAYIKANADFEYFDSEGNLQTTSGNANLAAGNIKSGVAFFGTTGTYGADCSADGSVGCVTTSVYKSANTTGLTGWSIRAGTTIAGVSGQIAYYRNAAKLSLFNRITGTASSSSGTTADPFDTVDDGAADNNATDGVAPASDNPTGFPGVPGSSNWTVGTANVHRDLTSNSYWTPDQGTYNWEGAITYCDGLTLGGYTDWRLPTQKELLQAYIDGIWHKSVGLSITHTEFWVATTNGYNLNDAMNVQIYAGYTGTQPKSNSLAVLCVR
ncbi:MAG: DUF1566 domain-containing protein [Proteobacteria bacterium]|nr:MAG: DUF1566 domain-containing protein [Pseudomonadota bacterium]